MSALIYNKQEYMDFTNLVIDNRKTMPYILLAGGNGLQGIC
jgi:hypothetical protein